MDDGLGSSAGSLLHLFSMGSQVEVNTDEEGFKGAWYLATVIDSLPSSNPACKRKRRAPNEQDKLYVEYQSLLEDDENELEPLREAVNVAFLRPCPLPDARSNRSFQLNDAVDAYYKDGWWAGVITMLLENSRFLVTFQNPPDEIEFETSELRFHQEWINGKWYSSRDAAAMMLSMETTVEVSFGGEYLQDAWFPATVLEELENGSFLVEYKSSRDGHAVCSKRVSVNSLYIRPSPPHIKVKRYAPLEKVDVLYEGGWWSGVIAEELTDYKYNVSFKYGKIQRELSHLELRPHMEWKNGKWFSNSMHIRQHCKLDKEDHLATEFGKKKKGRRGSESRMSRQHSTGGKVKGVIWDLASEFVEEDCTARRKSLPVVIGLECSGMRGSGSKQPQPVRVEGFVNLMIDQKLPLNVEETYVDKESHHYQGAQKRRGRPPKNQVLAKKCSSNRNDSVSAQAKFPNPRAWKRLVGRDGRKLRNVTLKETQTTYGSTKMILDVSDEPLVDNNEQNLAMPREKHSERKVPAKNIYSARPILDSEIASGADVVERQNFFKELDMEVENLPKSMADDQPLLMWIEGMAAPATLDGASTPTKVCDGMVDNPEEFITPSSVINNKAVEIASFPFVRKSVLWKAVESIDVFKKIPQKPHFSPLCACKEPIREGLAIGSMVTFSRVVESVSSMQINHPKSVMEECLETLYELETHGFNVQSVRDRIQRLLSMKDNEERLQDEMKEFERQIEVHNIKLVKTSEELDDIDKQIKDLEEKRAMIMAEKETYDSQIASMQLKLDCIDKRFGKVRLSFESLSSAPW